MKNCLALVIFEVMMSLLSQRAHAQVVIIVNPSVKAVTLSKADLRDIFTGASSSLRDGSAVTPVLLQQGPIYSGFLSLYLAKSDSAFRATWRSVIFSGQGVMPKSFDSEAAVVEYVARTPGAIGYVRISTPHEGVRVMALK